MECKNVIESTIMSTSISEIIRALGIFQDTLDVVVKEQKAKIKSKDGSKEFEYTYADLPSIRQTIKGPLKSAELCFCQIFEIGGLTTVLFHAPSGQWIKSTIPMNFNLAPKDLGSQITYLRRYALCSILGIAADKDDDGTEAQQAYEKKTKPEVKENIKNPSKVIEAEFLQQDEVKHIELLIGQDYELADRILDGYSQKYKEPVTTFYDLRKKDYPAILTRINAVKPSKPFARQA